MQDDLLAKYQDRDLKVYAIWLAMLRTDERSSWPRNEIVDPRASHYWDPAKVVGTALARGDEMKAWRPVAWDIWAMYPPGTTWHEGPPRPGGSGRTILKSRDRLDAAVAALPTARSQ